MGTVVAFAAIEPPIGIPASSSFHSALTSDGQPPGPRMFRLMQSQAQPAALDLDVMYSQDETVAKLAGMTMQLADAAEAHPRVECSACTSCLYLMANAPHASPTAPSQASL